VPLLLCKRVEHKNVGGRRANVWTACKRVELLLSTRTQSRTRGREALAYLHTYVSHVERGEPAVRVPEHGVHGCRGLRVAPRRAADLPHAVQHPLHLQRVAGLLAPHRRRLRPASSVAAHCGGASRRRRRSELPKYAGVGPEVVTRQVAMAIDPIRVCEQNGRERA
jgi:hypothetical protein